MLSSTPTTSGWPSGTNAATSRPSKILEPCRPDHAPRDRNRWNRLKPLSDAPSTARRAAQTVRWFRHSNAPVASATAFNQVGCVNSTANGASQVSIARAFPGCAIFATIGFPMRQTHGKLRSCLQNLRTSSRLWGHYRAAWETAKVQHTAGKYHAAGQCRFDKAAASRLEPGAGGGWVPWTWDNPVLPAEEPEWTRRYDGWCVSAPLPAARLSA